MMALLSEKDAQQVQSVFAEKMKNPVRLLVFTREENCQYCDETRQIVEEVAGLSDLITVDIQSIDDDNGMAHALGIDKAPAIAVQTGGDDAQDYGIRYYGIPSGYEFSSVIEDVVMVSSGDSGLNAETRQALAELEEDVHFQVFVTPT